MAALAEAAYGAARRSSARAARFARDNPIAAGAVLVLALLGVLAAFGPLIAPFDPLEFHAKDRFAGPSGTYLMGTD